MRSLQDDIFQFLKFRLKPFLMPCVKCWTDSLLHFCAQHRASLELQRNEAASSSCKATCWTQSLCLLSTSTSVVSQGIRVDALGRSRQWFAALACLRGWRERGEEVSVVLIGAATNSLAQCALWVRALRMMIDGPNTFVANAVISACCRSKLLGRAVRIVDTMSLHGPEPDTVTLNTLLNIYSTEGLASRAEGLMASVRKMNLQPNLLSYNLFLTTLQRSAKWSETLSCLKKIDIDSVNTDAVTVNSVLAACMRRLHWQHGLGISSRSQNDIVALSTVGSTMIQRNVWACASHILELVHSSSLQPDADTFAVLGSSSRLASKDMSETSASQTWLLASRLLAACKLQETDANGVLIGSSIATCSRSRQWKLSIDLLAEVQKASLRVDDVVAYNSITSGSWHHSHRIFEDMSHRHLEPDLASWNSLMTSSSSAATWRLCCYCLEALNYHGLRADEILLSTNLGAMNSAPWHMSIEAMRQAGKVDATDPILTSVVLRASAKLSWERSLQLSQGMRKMILDRNETDSGLQNAVLTAYQEGNAWPQSLQLLKDLLVHQCEPEGLGVSAAFTACGISNWGAMMDIVAFLQNGLAPRLTVDDVMTCECKISLPLLRWIQWELEQRKLWSFGQMHRLFSLRHWKVSTC